MAIYEPTATPAEYPSLRAWLARQLRNVADTLKSPSVRSIHFDILHAEPERFSNGDVVAADGSDWNPGSGGGLYMRFGGAWVKL